MAFEDQNLGDIASILNIVQESARNQEKATQKSINLLERIAQVTDATVNIEKNQETGILKLLNQQKQLERVINSQTKSYIDVSNSNTKRVIDQLQQMVKAEHSLTGKLQDYFKEIEKSQRDNAPAKQQRQLDTTISKRFKAISSSMLTKQDFADIEAKKTRKDRIGVDYKPLTRYEKQTLKEQQLLNTKMGALLKDAQDDRKKPQGSSGIMKLLGPFALLFGGIAALSYGIMKFPLARRMLEDLKGSRIGTSITGFLNKLKPQDKTIKEWLRGLPFIGRLFDIYDGFQQIFQGNIKQGLKHFAFAIPGAEWLANMIGSSKKEMLQPGGMQKAVKEFSLQKTWERVRTYFTDTLIKPITDTYSKLSNAFSIMGEGSRAKILEGLMILSKDFPSIAPVANFVSNLTNKVFDFTLGKLDINKPEDWQGFNEQTLGGIFNKIYEGVSSYLSKIMDVFGQIGTFVGHFANIFSDDYGKQSAALNAIEELSPPIGSMLRTVLGMVENFKTAGIEEGDSAFAVITKLTSAAFKGSAQGKFGKSQTQAGEIGYLSQQMQQLDKTKDADRLSVMQERLNRIQYKAEEDRIREQMLFNRQQYKQMQQHIDQPGSGYGFTQDMATTGLLTGAAALVPGIGPLLAAGVGTAGTAYSSAKGLKGVWYDIWNRGKMQEEAASFKAAEIENKKRLYERWRDVGSKIGEEPPEEILDIIKQDIESGMLPASILQSSAQSNRVLKETPVVTPTKVTATPVSVPDRMTQNTDQVAVQATQNLVQKQDKLVENTKYLPELYLLLQRMYPDIAAIKDTNAGMLNQGPGNVTSLIQGGTNYSFRSGDSGVSRNSLNNQWSMTK